jgi:hypothetical protein
MFVDAIETAVRIALIAESALRRRIPIRWFDFSGFEKSKKASGGIGGFLEPISAIESRRPPLDISDLALFFALRL